MNIYIFKYFPINAFTSFSTFNNTLKGTVHPKAVKNNHKSEFLSIKSSEVIQCEEHQFALFVPGKEVWNDI